MKIIGLLSLLSSFILRSESCSNASRVHLIWIYLNSHYYCRSSLEPLLITSFVNHFIKDQLKIHWSNQKGSTFINACNIIRYLAVGDVDHVDVKSNCYFFVFPFDRRQSSNAWHLECIWKKKQKNWKSFQKPEWKLASLRFAVLKRQAVNFTSSNILFTFRNWFN